MLLRHVAYRKPTSDLSAASSHSGSPPRSAREVSDLTALLLAGPTAEPKTGRYSVQTSSGSLLWKEETTRRVHVNMRKQNTFSYRISRQYLETLESHTPPRSICFLRGHSLPWPNQQGHSCERQQTNTTKKIKFLWSLTLQQTPMPLANSPEPVLKLS